MRGKVTIIIAVLEAIVLLTIKLCDWKESKAQKPMSGKARRAAGRRVVNPAQPEYDTESPRGDNNAAYLSAGGSAADKTIHEEE